MANSGSLEKLAKGLEALEEALSSGIDPNACDSTGGSLLAHAAAQGNVNVVTKLLGAGAVPDAFGVDPSPLVLAAEGGHAEVVRLLLAAGAKLGGEEWWDDGELALWSAVRAAQTEVVAVLLDSGAADCLVREWIEATVEAASGLRGKKKALIVEMLGLALARRAGGSGLPEVSHSSLDVLVRGLRNHPRAAAILKQRIDESKALEEEVVDLYAEEGRYGPAMARVESAPEHTRSWLATLLLPWAVHGDRLADVERLEDWGADPFAIGQLGRSAFMYAVGGGLLPLVERWIARGADCRAIANDGATVLECAYSGPSRPLLVAELQRTAADYDCRVDRQLDAYTNDSERIARASAEALMAAREERWDRALALLVQGDPNWVSGRNERVLTEAARQGRKDLVDQLLGLGASPGEGWVLSKLIDASFSHSVEMEEWMLRKLLGLGYRSEVTSRLLGAVGAWHGDAVGDWTLRTLIADGHGDEVFTPELLERVHRLRREMAESAGGPGPGSPSDE